MKNELYNFFLDKKGNLSSSKLKWTYIKQFPDIYSQFINYYSILNENEDKPIDILYMMLNNIYEIPKCPICGSKLHVLKINKGFEKFCSLKCKYSDKGKEIIYNKIKETFLNNYGTETPTKLVSVKLKQQETNLKKYGFKSTAQNPIIKQKQQDTLFKHYGVFNSLDSDDIKNKVHQTKLLRYGDAYFTNRIKAKQTIQTLYGVDNVMQHDSIKDKARETKKKNKTCTTSSIETKFYEYLISCFNNSQQQYKSSEYPYSCDFYISDLNLYIEIQGNWTHGKHPFNNNDINDIDILNQWKILSESKHYYNSAIDVWTIRDVKKRNTAIKNNLNYLEIFTCKVENAIDALNKYIHQDKSYQFYIYEK